MRKKWRRSVRNIMHIKDKKQKRILITLIILIILVIFILLMLFSVWRVCENCKNPFKWRTASRYNELEELCQFVTDHPEELDALVEEIYQAYVKDGEVWIYLAEDYWEEYDQSFPVAEALIRENAIQSISARRTSLADGKDTFWIQLEFDTNMKKENGLSYSCVGIYYVENGVPMPWEVEMEGQSVFEEVDGVYVQYRTWSDAAFYQTKYIAENWYYYLCD